MAKTKEERAEYYRKYYAANRDEIIAYSKEYAAAHKEEIAAKKAGYNRLNYEKSKSDRAAKAKEYRKDPKVKERLRQNSVRWRANNQEKQQIQRHASNLRVKYELTIEQYLALSLECKGLCNICGEPETRVIKGTLAKLCVDHCHKSGEIRGLLCNDCNVGLGKFKDNVRSLERAIAYLTKHQA